MLPESDLETVARRLAERLAIDVDLGSVITSRDHEPWLEGRKQDIDWGRWLAYKKMLIQHGRALTVIDKTDELTDKILDLAGDPTKPGSWTRRGLVLGDVQSGKTGTYLALFNKAADADTGSSSCSPATPRCCASRPRRASTRRSSGATHPTSSRVRAPTSHRASTSVSG